jgi:ribosomal protein S8
MTTQEIEKAIIDKLKENITDLKVEGFPEDLERFQFTHPKGMINVQYYGAKYDSSMTNNLQFISQKKRLQFFISVSLRSLRTHTGVYTYLDAVRNILTGYKIADSSILTKMYPIEEQFVNWNENIWTYAIIFEFVILTSEIEQ